MHVSNVTFAASSEYEEKSMSLVPYYTYITSSYSNLSKNGAIYAEVIGTSNVDKVVITTTLQQKGLFGWSAVEDWTGTYYSSYGILSRSTTLSPSKTYRLYTTYTVYYNALSETHTEYSNEV